MADDSPPTLEPATQEGEPANASQLEAAATPPQGPTTVPQQEADCIFCQIASGSKKTSTQFVHEDMDFVCFKDIRPQAEHHYLVVPKTHIRTLKYLSKDDIPKILRMEAIGKQVLQDNGGDLKDYRAGFHWPPFLTVNHLHMHVIFPESQMGFFARHIVFRKDSWVFSSPEVAVNYLKDKNKA